MNFTERIRKRFKFVPYEFRLTSGYTPPKFQNAFAIATSNPFLPEYQYQLPNTKIAPAKSPSTIIKNVVDIIIKFTIKLDGLAISFMLVFFISWSILLGLINIYSPTNQQILFMAFSIALFGVIGLISLEVVKDPLNIAVRMDNKNLGNDLLGGLMFLVPIFASNLILNALIPGSQFEINNDLLNIVFVITDAFGEEVLFSFFLCSLLFALAKTNLQRHLAVWGVGVLFAIYHIFVYQNWKSLAIVFCLRICLNYCYLKYQRLSLVILLHLINNIVSVLPQILILIHL